MFGFHPDKLVKEGKFEKLESEVQSSTPKSASRSPRHALASNEDGAYNVLVSILDKEDRECKMAAIKALGNQGRSSASTHLMHLMDASGTDAEMKKAIETALEQIHSHHES